MKLTKQQMSELQNSAIGYGFIAINCDGNAIGFTHFHRRADGKIYTIGGIEIDKFIKEIFVIDKEGK